MRWFIVILVVIGLLGWLSSSGANPPNVLAAPEVNPVPPGAYLTEFAARTLTPARRDNYELFARLKGGPANPTRTITKPVYKVGDQDTFTVFDLEQKRPYQVKASVVAITPHLYMFVDVNGGQNRSTLTQLADEFENKVYPTTRRYFGEEDTPGIDNDPHLVILNTSLKLASGYFSSDDTLLRSINPNSNEREMFYIASNPANSQAYLSTLAHEFQHMIEYKSLPNQDIWLNEGSSVLSQVLNGYNSGGLEISYFNQPETQLDTWACGGCGTLAHYGAGYSWLSLLKDHYSFEVVRSIAQNNQGLTGFNAVDYALYANGLSQQTSETILQQFVLTNYFNRRTADKAYNYQAIASHIDRLTPLSVNTPKQETLNQYGAAYYSVQGGDKGFTLNFQGAATTGLAPAKPHSGQMAWWSNRGDNSEMSLTRSVDLSNVKQATFSFWTWFNIEPNYDWLYIEVSTDDGKTWQVLPGAKYTTDRDPTGKQYGPGMTGQSGAEGLNLTDTEEIKAVWVNEAVNLSKYAGQKIKLRLDYLTDEAYSKAGALFDDFQIPEIGWQDDVESGENGWESQGFIRSNVTLPQHFFVQVVRRDGECGSATTADLSKADNGQPCIQEVALDNTNAGRLTVPYRQAVIVVSPWAIKTVAPASYSLELK